MVAQLIGLGLSISLLNGIEATGDPTNAVWAWVVIQSVHVVLRFKSLSVVQFPSLNQKRSCVLINAFLDGQQMPGKATMAFYAAESNNNNTNINGFQVFRPMLGTY